jgi:hypothetical protein
LKIVIYIYPTELLLFSVLVCMRAKAGILCIIVLLLLTGVATAVSTTMTSDRTWLVANNTENANISATFANSTGVPVSGATVTLSFTVSPPFSSVPYSGDQLDYGSLTNYTATTNGNGQVFSVFHAKTKSGAAHIVATVAYTDPDGKTYTANVSKDVGIDHDSPYITHFDYADEGTVATVVPFNITVVDMWNNRIDNRAEGGGVHNVSLHVNGPSPNDCGFEVGTLYPHDISKSLDANGNLSVNVKLTSKYGSNNILLDSFGSVSDQLVWITAVTTAPPYTITQVIDPPGSPPSLPVNEKFTIKYMLYDKFGNPTGDQQVWVNTSVLGESTLYRSNSIGQVWVYYVEPYTGLYNITATSVSNTSVNITGVVRFYNTSASDFVMMVNPESMASHEVNISYRADVRAKVMDAIGNPVQNETVLFSINSITYPGGPYNATADPNLNSVSAVTNNDGLAIVQFTPGAFSQDIHSLHYSPTATGTCMVSASWNGISKEVPATWKNYPYLSATTSVSCYDPVKGVVSCQKAHVNNTVDVSLVLRGDGWALQKMPIDVVLANDRSGSMVCGYPDRSYAVREASKIFVDSMSTKDQVGLVSFGGSGTYYSIASMGSACTNGGVDSSYTTLPRTYSDYATLDKILTDYTGYNGVKTELNKMIPDGNTPERYALKKSIDHLASSGRSSAIRAVILLSDGDYNIYGDPLARGSGYPTSTYSATGSHYSGSMTNDYVTFSDLSSSNQNMSTYANSNGIRIYTIAFGSGLSSGAITTLKILANTTGGKYYAASDTDIEDVYRQIAGDLQQDAGVDTEAIMDYGTVTVNNESVNGAEIFDYVPDPVLSGYLPTRDPGSTWTYKYNVTPSGAINTLDPAVITDQSDNWTLHHQLDFNVGTVKINETWAASFRLELLREGNINVFGPDSIIRFNDSLNTGVDHLAIPPAYISVSQNTSSSGITMKTIYLHTMFCTEPGEIKALLPVQWNTTYTGVLSVNELVYYAIVDDDGNPGSWIQYDSLSGVPPGETTQFSQLPVADKPAGGYKIRVVAMATDAPDDEIILSQPVQVGGRGKMFIKLE